MLHTQICSSQTSYPLPYSFIKALKEEVTREASFASKAMSQKLQSGADNELNVAAFSKAEDDLLVYFHGKYGGKWTKIASRLNHKTARQCRERWNTYFSQRVNKPWTDEETAQLLEYHKMFGKNFDVIGKLLNRSQTQVKNRINAINKKVAQNSQETPQISSPINYAVSNNSIQYPQVDQVIQEPYVQITAVQAVTPLIDLRSFAPVPIQSPMSALVPMEVDEFISKFR